MHATYYGSDSEDDDPRIRYLPQQLTLGQIVDNITLPSVIQSDLGFLEEKRLDLSQPLFAFSKRSVRKVSARNVEWENNDTSSYHFVGQELLIPEDYTGWFAVVGSPRDILVKKSSKPYRSVSHMTNCSSGTFLVGGITPIKTYFMTLNKGVFKHTSHHILPGDIIRKGSKRVLKEDSPALVALYDQHAECRDLSFAIFHDEKDRTILLRTNQNGVFFPVYEAEGSVTGEKTLAMQLSDIIRLYRPPVVVKLLHGWVPAIECGFTGTFHLHDVALEDTVVASTFYREVAVSLEIPLDSDVKFQVAITNEGLKSSEQWVNALRHCKANAPNYTKAIKVIRPDGSVDIDESDLEIRSCGLTLENQHPPDTPSATQLPSPRTPGRDTPTFEPVQLRRPHPVALDKQCRASTVKCLSRRVGLYAMDHSYNTRELTIKRKGRKNAFREGRMGRQRPKTTPETLPRYGNGNERKHMPPYPGVPGHAFDALHRNDTDEAAIPIPSVSGGPVRPSFNISSEYANVDDGHDSNPLYTPRNFPGGYEEVGGDEGPNARRTRSCVFHVIQQENGDIFTVSPFTRNEEVHDEGYCASDSEDGRCAMFLFHGSIPSQDDYISPVDSPYDFDQTFVKRPLSPAPSFRPPLPPRSRAPIPNALSGCYNREMLIEELKKATPVSTTEELALKSLTMVDISVLLSGPTDDLENMLLSLAPRISPQNLKNIALFFKSFRGQVRILTEL